jgi:hypothetical protein
MDDVHTLSKIKKSHSKIPPNLPCLSAPVPTEGGAGRLSKREAKIPPLIKGGGGFEIFIS